VRGGQYCGIDLSGNHMLFLLVCRIVDESDTRRTRGVQALLSCASWSSGRPDVPLGDCVWLLRLAANMTIASGVTAAAVTRAILVQQGVSKTGCPKGNAGALEEALFLPGIFIFPHSYAPACSLSHSVKKPMGVVKRV
jgi:hypothetical protein